MSHARLCLLLLLLPLSAFAADLRIVVADPSGAAVSGARVTVYRGSDSMAVQSTAADGSARFTGLATGRYRIEVLAPGFTAETRDAALPEDSPITIGLAVAASPSTVVVTATRTPVTSEESGAPVEALDEQQLVTMQPVDLGESLRFLPGAIVSDAGQRGGLASLFVRGGESRYNKVIIDGVPVNDPGGTFNFGVVPMEQVDRLEFVRGAESTLYGSDAMTSVVQLWSASGRTPTPEFTFGSDGGNYGTAHGYASLAGARGRLDYNLFGDQFNTAGRALNDDYSNSSEGLNVGVALTRASAFRLRVRHSSSRSGVQNEWDFNGNPLLPPDADQHARNNDFLGSAEFAIAHERWQHHFWGFEYNERRRNQDLVADRTCAPPFFLDCPFDGFANLNRAGLEYQGEYTPRTWSTTVIGGRFEVENGSVGELLSDSISKGTRHNGALYVEQILVWRRLTAIGGVRYEHNESFGDRAVPRIALTLLAVRGGDLFSGTRLRFVYATGIKAPRFEESFGSGVGSGFTIFPNPNLRAEQNRSFEAGIVQDFRAGKYSLTANYFNNLFTNQIDFNFVSPSAGQYFNLNSAIAHGAELVLHGRPLSRLSVDSSYVYTSSQVLGAPFEFDPFLPGQPLLRRPKHAGSLLGTWTGHRWGASLGGTLIGRRADRDFLFGAVPAVDHTAGYARFDMAGWYDINSRLTAYAALNNAFDKQYEDVAGYPALGTNIRAGLRLRLGGEK